MDGVAVYESGSLATDDAAAVALYPTTTAEAASSASALHGEGGQGISAINPFTTTTTTTTATTTNSDAKGESESPSTSPPSSSSSSSYHPLHRAALEGDVRRLQELLDQGEKIEQKLKDGRTPLHLAVVGKHFAALRFLVRAGANVDAADSLGYTPITTACQIGSILMLFYLALNEGNIELKDNDGHSPVHWAAYKGHVPCLAALRALHADFKTVDFQGKNALHWAAFNEEVDSCRFLLIHYPQLTNCRDNNGNTPYETISSNNNTNDDDDYGADSEVAFLLSPSGPRGIQASTTFIENVREFTKRDFRLAFWFSFAIFVFLFLFFPSTTSTSTSTIFPQFLFNNSVGRVASLLLSFVLLFVWNVIRNKNRPYGIEPDFILQGWVYGILGGSFFALLWRIVPSSLPHLGIAVFVFVVLFSATGFSYWKTSSMDAGEVKPEEGSIATAEFNRLVKNGSFPYEKFCVTCEFVQPLRAKHCPVCNACIHRMDHHCAWMATCVGERNHVMFVFFLLSAWLFGNCGSILGLASSIYPSFSLDNNIAESIAKVLVHFIIRDTGMTIGCFVSASLTNLLVLPILFNQIVSVSMNVTQNERLVGHRYRHFGGGAKRPWISGEGRRLSRPPTLRNPFNRGFVSNWVEFAKSAGYPNGTNSPRNYHLEPAE